LPAFASRLAANAFSGARSARILVRIDPAASWLECGSETADHTRGVADMTVQTSSSIWRSAAPAVRPAEPVAATAQAVRRSSTLALARRTTLLPNRRWSQPPPTLKATNQKAALA